MIIPNIVQQMTAKFGYITLVTLANDGVSPLGRVIGLRQVETMVHVRRLKEDEHGSAIINKAKSDFEEETIQFPSILLLATDEHDKDITNELLSYAEEVICNMIKS